MSEKNHESTPRATWLMRCGLAEMPAAVPYVPPIEAKMYQHCTKACGNGYHFPKGSVHSLKRL